MSYYEFQTAKRYVQYPGALREFARYACPIGKRLLIITASNTVKARLENDIRESFIQPCASSFNKSLIDESPKYAAYVSQGCRFDAMKGGMEYSFIDVRNKVLNAQNAQTLAAYVKARQFDVVVGTGGGKGLDFARAVTHFTPVKVILVPTTAATNASISQCSVIYSDDGSKIREYWQMDTAPELVLADTEILLDTAPSILASGMGDIISTYYEALCSVALTHSKEKNSLLSVEGIRLAIDIVMRCGTDALSAVKTHKSNPAFECVLSLILHNCGPFRAICGLGFAHVLDEIMLSFPAAHKVPHGLRVGFATIPMLLYQGASPAVINRYLAFCRQTGIPSSLAEIGLEHISWDEWLQAAEKTVAEGGGMTSLPYPLSVQNIIHSLKRANAYIESQVCQSPCQPDKPDDPDR